MGLCVASGAAAQSALPSGSSPAPSGSSTAAAGQPPKSEPTRTRLVDKTGPMALPDDLPDKPRFVVVELHDEVSLGMASLVERVSEELRPGDVLVLDIRTFGGRVDAAVRIRDAVLATHAKDARAVAFINPRAISAGALIAYATDVIVVAGGATMGASAPVNIGSDQKMEAAPEKVVSYMRKEMRATAEARGRNGDVAEAMVDHDIAVKGLSEAGKLLTLDGNEALAWGVANFQAESHAELVSGLGYGGSGHPTVHFKANWAEQLAGFLSSSGIASLLMSIGMLGLMVGLYSGNHTVVLVGALCLLLFFFGHFVVRLTGIEDIALFAAGLMLIGYEAYAPGHVLPGAIGVICVLAALIMGLIDFSHVGPSVQWAAGYLPDAIATVFGSIIGTVVLGAVAVKLLPRSRFGQGLLLQAQIQARATDAAPAAKVVLTGAVGEAVSDLLPSGKVRIGKARYDAKAEYGSIDRGTRVEVVRRVGFELIVVPLEASEQAAPSDQAASADVEPVA